MYELSYYLVKLIKLALLHQLNSHQKLQQNTFFFSCHYVYIHFICVCSVYWNPQPKHLNVFKNKLMVSGWAGKGSSAVVLYDVEHINGIHKMLYLFDLWLPWLEKEVRNFSKTKHKSTKGRI